MDKDSIVDLSDVFLHVKAMAREALTEGLERLERNGVHDTDAMRRQFRDALRELDALAYDSTSLRPTLPSMAGGPQMYEDTRIESMLTAAFPPGHPYHEAIRAWVCDGASQLEHTVANLRCSFDALVSARPSRRPWTAGSSTDGKALFEGAKAGYREVLQRALGFLKAADGGVDRTLEGHITDVLHKVEALSFAPDALYAYSLSGGKEEWGDARIDGLFSENFPLGHAFHSVIKRRMLADLDKLERGARMLRKLTE